MAAAEQPPETGAQRRRQASSFGTAAAEYAAHRPRYAEAAIRWCLEPAGPARPRVADIGAGTGILTGALAGLGAEVIAVEPDPRMLAELRGRFPGVRAETGRAEAIPLPDGSVDVVLAAQSMHWFEVDRAWPEIARVLAPGGVLAGLWNVYDDRTDWVAGLAKVSDYQTLLRWRASFGDTPFGGLLTGGTAQFAPAELSEFGNRQRRTASSLVATIATHSHLLTMPASQRTLLLAHIRDFLQGCPETSAGEFDLPLVTVAVRARKR